MRVAIYSVGRKEDPNCQTQIKALEAYAKAQNFTVVGRFLEDVSDSLESISQRCRVMVLARRGGIDLVLTTKLSDWARTFTDLATSLTRLRDLNVSLIALNGLNVDLLSGQGQDLVDLIKQNILLETAIHGTAVKEGIAVAKATGKRLGRPSALSERIAEKVTKIKDLDKQGLSKRKIAERLKMSHSTVYKVLAQEEAI